MVWDWRQWLATKDQGYYVGWWLDGIQWGWGGGGSINEFWVRQKTVYKKMKA